MSIYTRLQRQEQELRQLGQILAARLSHGEMRRLQAICDGIMTERVRIRESRESAWRRICESSMEDSLPATW